MFEKNILPPQIGSAREIIDILLSTYYREFTPPDWSRLAGLHVLDIGSGAQGRLGAQPYFSRLCALRGAQVYAIDIRPQSRVDKRLFFQAIQADIIPSVLSGQFSQIPGIAGREFDIIHCSGLVGANPDPDFCDNLFAFGTTPTNFQQLLTDQALELLAPNGVMYIGGTLIQR